MNTVNIKSKSESSFLGFKVNRLFLISLFVCQEIKPVEPFTLAIVGAGAMTLRAFSKTSAGKVMIVYVLGQATKTPAGKYLIAQVQNRAGIMLQKRAQKNFLTTSEFFNTRSLALQAYIAAMVPSFFKRADLQFCESTGGTSMNKFTSYDNVNISRKIRKLRDNLTFMKKGEQNFKINPEENVSEAFSSMHAHFNQTNIHQEVHFGSGSTFVSANAAAVNEYGKKQFWKGVTVGGAAGATAVAWWEKKRNEQAALHS